ncbi:MAG: hypothetical protein Q7R77_03510 [Candidatus Daviesbacteria bacterium]|nr:hypothetical protein [Candidatus Daviesbacteria bacterium]
MSDQSAKLPPPIGDAKAADRYISQLIELIRSDKLTVKQTDLAKFDPSSLQNHYRLDLKTYEVEVSHSKQTDTGKDFYIILFNNLKQISGQCAEKVILAYIHLTGDQFRDFKATADDQLERRRKEAEEKRFTEAMTPIDETLEQLVNLKTALP